MDHLDTLDRNKKLFPQKMWDLIHDERYHFCLRWSDDGQLVYLNRDEFEESYLKKPCNQFNTQKSISFVRQMNMYGFRKVDDCYYENDNFKRNCYHLLKNMIRRHPNKAPFNDYFPTQVASNTTTGTAPVGTAKLSPVTQLTTANSLVDSPNSFENTTKNSNTSNAAKKKNNTNNNNNNHATSDGSSNVLQDIAGAIKQQDPRFAATHTIEPAHHHHLINTNHHQNFHHHQHHNHIQLHQQQQHQYHADDLSTSSASPISDEADHDVIMDTQQQEQSQQIHMNHLMNHNNPLDHSSLAHPFVRSLLQLHNHHQQPQDLSSHHMNKSTNNNNMGRMSKSSSSSNGGVCGIGAGGHDRTPSPMSANNRFIINNNLVTSHSNSNNGSLSSTPSPSPSIDNNSINHMLNGHNFQQQLSNMVLNISNQALQLGNNNCPIKYDPIQVSEMINHAQIPELQLEFQHHLEQLAQLPPVSPLTKKLVTEICSRRNALMDQSALLDAARYTEKFLNVLLDDALLIAQHSAGLDPADTAAQQACSSIDASSLTLALKLLPSKLLSSLQIYNNK